VTTLASELAAAAAAVPDRVFVRSVRTVDGTPRVEDTTYARMHAWSLAAQDRLQARGIGPGDAVAVLAGNSAAQVALWFALGRLRALHAPLNTTLAGPRLAHALRVAGARLVVADPDVAPAVAQAGVDVEVVPLLDVTGECPDAAPAPPSPLAPSSSSSSSDLDTATLLFTSGTTGPSKACALSHTYLVRAGQLHAQALGLRADDVLYCPFPLFHIDCATLTVSAALAVRGTAAVGTRFSASGFWGEVRATGATVFNFMGATLTILWKRDADPRDRDHRVRLAWGVPMPDWAPRFEARFGVPLRQVYGLTDAGVPVYDPPQGRRPPAAGRVLPQYEVRVDEPGPDGAGEILVRGREPGLVMNGYHGDPAATAATLVDGWVRTGDLGRLDDGWLTFLGRLSDSIRRRGENISCFEVEEVVGSHPGVLEVAALGVPSELTEEDVMVYVVARPGRTLDPADVRAHALAHGPAYMAPRYVEVVDALPKTPTEKVEKVALAARGVTPATWDAARYP
jgi:crotonobetaine/carnitine-CoA ligase